MTIGISNFLFSKGRTAESHGTVDRPMQTSIPVLPSLSSPARIMTQDYRMMINRLRQIPEIISTIQILITDILGERMKFYDAEGNPLSYERHSRIKNWVAKQNFKETLSSFLIDILLQGEGFLWKGKPNQRDIEIALKQTSDKLGLDLSNLKMKEMTTQIYNETYSPKEPKKLDVVAASSMHIIFNELDILKYEQIVHTLKAEFDPKEIIHFRLWRVDGQVRGFSPAEALLMEFEMLRNIKFNMRAFFENGGTPNKAFILPKEMANSPNHQYLINILKKYKRIQNRHGNLVFTGELDIKDIESPMKDLEFKDLSLYMTSVLAYAWGIPSSRIPFLIGSSSSNGDSGGLAEAGYFNRISYLQDSLEDALNSQFFNDYDLSIRFNRKYKQDEVRDAQTDMMKADAIIKYQEILGKCGKKMTDEKILRMLGWDEKDIDKLPQELNTYLATNNQRQGLEDDMTVQSEPDKLRRNDTKRQATEKNSGATSYNP